MRFEEALRLVEGAQGGFRRQERPADFDAISFSVAPL